MSTRPPDRTDPGEREATVFLTDVYRGPAMRGVPRGTVERLRLFSYNYLYRDTIARGLLWLTNNPSLFVATTLIGNNAANYMTSLAIVLPVNPV